MVHLCTWWSGSPSKGSKLISMYCLCHELILACTDTSGQIEYIQNVELWLRQLWKLFDNQLKRTAVCLKVQISLKSLVLSEMGKKILTKEIKRAGTTRWLSFDVATSAIYEDFTAILQTLRQLKDTDAVTSGLLSKTDSSKFIGTILTSLKKFFLFSPTWAKTSNEGKSTFHTSSHPLMTPCRSWLKLQIPSHQ